MDKQNFKKEIALTTKEGLIKKEGKSQKMKPFSKNQERKWVINKKQDKSHSCKTKVKKLEMQNANRSLKKGVRQELKRDLDNRVNEFFE